MTWVKVTRPGGYRFSNTRITRYFGEGDHENIPRYMAEKIVGDGAGIKEVKPRETKGPDTVNVPKANSGQ